MSMEEILADVKVEGKGEDPFAALDRGVETPAESPAVKEPEEAKPEEGEKVETDESTNTPKEKDEPFHKNPRWIERENELRTLRDKEEENQRIIQDLTRFKDEVAPKLASIKEGSDSPEWFKEAFGTNPDLWEKYKREERDNLKKEVKQEIYHEQELYQRQAQQESHKWEKWVDDSLASLEGRGEKFDRNELVKTMLDYRPTDERGNYDFEAGLRIYKTMKGTDQSAKVEARKKVADATSGGKTGETKRKDYMTTNDLRHKSWNEIIK